MEIAELGSRSYAFIIDWHFRFLLSLACWVGAWFLLTGGGSESISSVAFGGEVRWRAYLLFLPALVIYVFYHPVLEIVLDGRTPGKRMAGVRLVTASGQLPGVSQILIRNLFRFVDSLPMFYAVGCVACVATTMRVRIGDMAAGTLLVYEDKMVAEDLERGRNIVSSTELSHSDYALLLDIVERWKTLDREARIDIATRFLTRVGRAVPAERSVKRLEKALHGRLQQLSGMPAG